MIRVLVVDDNAIFRQGMRRLVDSIPGLEVAADAGDGASGVDAAVALQVDIVLMDLAMPGLSGIDATRKLTAAAPHIGIIAMTMLEADDMVVQALRAARAATSSRALRNARSSTPSGACTPARR